jgi:hypothetical protein
MDAARSLLKSSDFDSQLEQTTRQSAGATYDTILAALTGEDGTPVPEDLKASVRAILLEDVEGMIADMKLTALDQAAAIYARYFTADELRELERLQTNPIMVKFRRIAPGFMTELSQIGVAAAAARMPAMRAKVEAAVDQWKRSNAESEPEAGTADRSGQANSVSPI